MSTMNIEKNGNVITISGPDMTNDFEQMKRECCGRYERKLWIFMREEVQRSIMILFIATIVLIKRITVITCFLRMMGKTRTITILD